MKIVDAHLHASGRETAAETLRALDEAGVEMACILAPFLTPPYSLHDAQALRAANEHVAALVRGHEDRLTGFAVVNPGLAGAAAEVERAVSLGLRGLKLVPAGWYPYDEAAMAVYAAAERLGLPVLFHSGVFIDGRSSRFCRPAYYEAVRDTPGLRVTLAHLGWPWSDEAIAVALIDRIRGLPPGDCQFRLDISFGPPPPYRLEAVGRAWQVLGAELLLYGSDRFLPCSGSELRQAWRQALELLEELGLADGQVRQVLAENALEWLRASRGPEGQPSRGGTDLAGPTGEPRIAGREPLNTAGERTE